MKTLQKKYVFGLLLGLQVGAATAQQEIPVMETGGQVMPNEWIDKDTHHKIIKLTRRDGANRSFYFHNNPFVGDEMLFVGSDAVKKSSDMIFKSDAGVNNQMYAVNLKTLGIRQITHQPYSVRSEIVCARTHEMFYQHNDSVFAVDINTCQRRFIAVLPKGKTGGIVTINADGTYLAGTYNNPKEAEIVRQYPAKHDFFNRIFEAKLEKTIFILNTQTGKFENVYTENAWLNHLQFSPTDPDLLLFCHEGPWHKVDRIWTINIKEKKAPRLMHPRTVYREIAGHEWFGASGKYIYFDLQKPRGETFYVGRVDVKTGEEQDFSLQRQEWSVHFVTSWDERFLVGDGGSPTSVAHSPEGQWIYRFDYDKDQFKTERLVNLKHHDYNLEPNVHFSPDNKWIIFRANFEGFDNVYAVEL